MALLGGLLSKRDADPGGEILSINGGRENKVPSKFSRVLPVLRRAKVVRSHHKNKGVTCHGINQGSWWVGQN